jgi:DNA-binding LacI/PurR family transcriptional regulator/AraC-like DNA-binding protein
LLQHYNYGILRYPMKKRQFLQARERAGKRVTIGFAGIADFRSVIGQEYIAGVTKAATDYGVNLINFAGSIKYSLSGDIDFIKHYLKKYRFMKSSIIDGLITWASSLDVYLSYEEIRELHDKIQPLPMVSLGVPILKGVPSVTIRSSDGIRLVMDHLVKKHGYTRIGFIGSSVGKQYQDRLDAWRLQMARHGLHEDPAKVFIMDTLEPREYTRCVDQLCQRFDLRDRQHIDALVTVSDIAAASLIEDLMARGFQVPRDIVIIGFNNQLQSISASCPITTVDLSFFNRGYRAVELLLDRIQAPGYEFLDEIVDSTLVVRQSCGCFEHVIEDAGHTDTDSSIAYLPESSNGHDDYARKVLINAAMDILPGFHPEVRERLVDALLRDIKGEPSEGLLIWIQRTVSMEHGLVSQRVEFYQNVLSKLRAIVLGLISDIPSTRNKMENIFHQARVMISILNDYYERSHRADAYRFNTLARIAISFASAFNASQVLDAIRYHLGELEMPGIMLVLQEELLPDLGSAALEFVHPPAYAQNEQLPYRIGEQAFIPRSFFPTDRPWCMMMEILYYAGMYIGYAMIEVGPQNVALYDAVRTLLSHSLYAVYVREGRNSRLRESLLRSDRVSGVLNNTSEQQPGHSSLGLDPQQIINYLVDHLGDMTDLDKMAKDLSISKSYLIRRTKSLTGYTVQALHEMLKIERAKIMLESGNIKISEIAGRLGYQNQCYFSSVFKKNTGMSPRDWSKRRG